MIKLTGLWESKDKNGNTVLSGKLGGAVIKIFANTYKKADNQPDFSLYLDETRKKENPESISGVTVVNEDAEPTDDELPF